VLGSSTLTLKGVATSLAKQLHAINIV
jgi:hypothetical protein